jgi:hypothetical protein
MTSLVHLLGREEVLLLLERRGVDVGREPVGDGVFAPEEEGVVPERGVALEVREDLLPLARVLAEVDLGGTPVAALPARVEIVVADRVAGRRRARGARLGRARSDPVVSPVHLYAYAERMYQEGRRGATPSCVPRWR